jgi:hypothetical protein
MPRECHRARKGIDARRLQALMENGELHSRLIKEVAAIDRILDEIIAASFTTPARTPPFAELVLSKLATYAKVTVIDDLPYRRRPRSPRHIDSLKYRIDARNFLAHTHRLPADTLPPRVEPWLYLLTDYSSAYATHLRAIPGMLRSPLLRHAVGRAA